MSSSPNVHQLPAAAVQEVPRDAEDDARELQAASEGVVLGDTVECMGERYRIGDKVGLMPLMRFAKSAKEGVDSDDLEGLVAIYDMLSDCIHPAEWDRFERDMTKKQAEADDLMPVVTRTLEILSARPTQRRSASSSGPERTTGTSTGGSSSPAPRVPPGAEDLVAIDQLASLG